MARPGFFPASSANYSRGDEPELARRLGRLARSLGLHLIGISGYRSPAHSVAVGGFPNDPHTRGEASDTPGIEGVPEKTLERFGLTRPFAGAREADHIQLYRGGRFAGDSSNGNFGTGRTRPVADTGGGGGGGSGAGGDGLQTMFANYMTEVQTPLQTQGMETVGFSIHPPDIIPNIPNPFDLFKGATGAVGSVVDFLKLVAWLINPRNILRLFEALVGFSLMLVGIFTFVQARKGDETSVGSAVKSGGSSVKSGVKELVQLTPQGRAARLARGARAGKAAARTQVRRTEYDRAKKRAMSGERNKQRGKLATREVERRYGKEPPF